MSSRLGVLAVFFLQYRNFLLRVLPHFLHHILHYSRTGFHGVSQWTQVGRGHRVVHGDKQLVEKLDAAICVLWLGTPVSKNVVCRRVCMTATVATTFFRK